MSNSSGRAPINIHYKNMYTVENVLKNIINDNDLVVRLRVQSCLKKYQYVVWYFRSDLTYFGLQNVLTIYCTDTPKNVEGKANVVRVGKGHMI